MAKDVEILIYQRLVPLAKYVLESSRIGLERLGLHPVVTDRPSGCNLVVTWGLGHPEGQRLIKETKARGGHVIGFDAGYFDRKNAFRVTFDHDHPQAFVMRRELPADRWDRQRIALGNDYDPNGHILLIGTGYKTADTYGEVSGDWERYKAATLIRQFAGSKLVFRPKPKGKNEIVPNGFTLDGSSTVELALRGCRLVVCRNSNAAVDAIIAGVPFNCEDGAAMAVADLQPLNEQTRLQFLRNLAWFNYTRSELRNADTWKSILKLME